MGDERVQDTGVRGGLVHLRDGAEVVVTGDSVSNSCSGTSDENDDRPADDGEFGRELLVVFHEVSFQEG